MGVWGVVSGKRGGMVAVVMVRRELVQRVLTWLPRQDRTEHFCALIQCLCTALQSKV